MASVLCALRKGQPQVWTWHIAVGSLVTTLSHGPGPRRTRMPLSTTWGSPQGWNPGISRENTEGNSTTPTGKSLPGAGQRESQHLKAFSW